MIPLNKPGAINNWGTTEFSFDQLSQKSELTFLSSAIDGLNLIYKYLKEKKGSLRVGVSPLTCFQAIYPIVAHGHIPVFIDVDEHTFNIDPSKLNKIDAVQAIHIGGNPCKMDTIQQWADDNQAIIIEDCAQAMGASFNGKYLGNFGDFSVFSLVKNLYTPAGGLLISKSPTQNYNLDNPSVSWKIYKSIKYSIEKKCSFQSIWNPIYFMLLNLKGDKAIGSINRPTAYKLPKALIDKSKVSIRYLEEMNSRRYKNARLFIDSAHEYYIPQAIQKNGISNYNRVMFYLKGKYAKDEIIKLRKVGIAANNLLQNYLCGFQEHISHDTILSRYYEQKKLPIYNELFPHIITIPNSPFLSNKEISHISSCLKRI